MTTALKALKMAMETCVAAGQEPSWEEVIADLWPLLSAPVTSEGERALLDVVRFEGQLTLSESSEFPHSMTPEDMLKSICIQALAKWTGLAHIREMQRVRLTTQSSSLSSLVGDVIEKARRDLLLRPARVDADEIADGFSDETKNLEPRPLGRERGMTYIRGLHRRSHQGPKAA